MAENRGFEPPMNDTFMELRSDREIVIARTFRGPARIVFDVYTRADLVKRWWAPKSLGARMLDCQADVRPGGTYRYLIRAGGGEEYAFSGRYTEVTPYSRLVYTQVFEPMADAGEVIVTATFDEFDGNTRFVSRELYPSKEARDATIASGMEKGMRETMNQLDELVVSLKGGAE
jgi:uncharacterized protein YndB with AHSA1/START domain